MTGFAHRAWHRLFTPASTHAHTVLEFTEAVNFSADSSLQDSLTFGRHGCSGEVQALQAHRQFGDLSTESRHTCSRNTHALTEHGHRGAPDFRGKTSVCFTIKVSE